MRSLFASLTAILAAGCASAAPPSGFSFSGAETTSAPPASEAVLGAPPVEIAGPTISDHLRGLCAPDAAFALGASGSKDDGLCTGEVSAAFSEAYARGAMLFAARVEVEQIKAEISAAQRELWAVKRNASMSTSGMAALSGRSDDRRALKADKDALAAESARLAAAVSSLQDALLRAEADVRARQTAGLAANTASAPEQDAPVAATTVSY